MDKIINGRELARIHEEILRGKVTSLSKTPRVVSILIGDDPASLKYSQMKAKKAESLGISFNFVILPVKTSYKSVENKIKELNNDPKITGVMVQLPLPEGFADRNETQKLLDLIDPEKDIDGLRSDTRFVPATVRGVISILKFEKLLGQGKKTVVVGGVRGKVGTFVVKNLSEIGEEVKGVSRDDPKLSEITRKADILISSTGSEGLIKPSMIKDGVVLIDVGLGDFIEECFTKASRYTPKIGGVGPMTVISLMENIIESFEKQLEEV